MTAEEARCLTRAALVNYVILAKMDADIQRAAKEGKYKGTFQFKKSDGYSTSITAQEYAALCDHYESVGFDVERKPGYTNYNSVVISWEELPDAKPLTEKTGGMLSNNVD